MCCVLFLLFFLLCNKNKCRAPWRREGERKDDGWDIIAPRGGRIEQIPDCTHGHTLVESGRMAEVSQAKIGPDDDVSATPKDPRIEWRNYKLFRTLSASSQDRTFVTKLRLVTCLRWQKMAFTVHH